MRAIIRRAVSCAALAILLANPQWAVAPAHAADPIKVGFNMALTGAVAFTPFAYAAGQVLAQAVADTNSLDHGKLADYNIIYPYRDAKKK
jgi:hypothetical protein